MCLHIAGGVSLHSIAISFETAVLKSILWLGHHYGISGSKKLVLTIFTNCSHKVCCIMFHVLKKRMKDVYSK